MMAEIFTLFGTFLFQLFLIVDPVAAMPILLSITRNNTDKEREKMVHIAIIVAVFVLLLFALAGKWILKYFNISIEAVQIAGGILLFSIGIEMIYGRNTRTEMVEEEKKAAIVQEDISVTPLGIPLLAGPGAITTVILFSEKITANPTYILISCLIIVAVCILSMLLLLNSRYLLDKLGKIGTKVVIRLMGLMVIFTSIQYVINGVKAIL